MVRQHDNTGILAVTGRAAGFVWRGGYLSQACAAGNVIKSIIAAAVVGGL
jgi:hypothetical protein